MLVKNRKKIPTDLFPHCKWLPSWIFRDPLNTKGNQRYSADASSTDFWLYARAVTHERQALHSLVSCRVLGCQRLPTTSIYRDELTKESQSLVNRLSWRRDVTMHAERPLVALPAAQCIVIAPVCVSVCVCVVCGSVTMQRKLTLTSLNSLFSVKQCTMIQWC